jgi:hypothetical protein
MKKKKVWVMGELCFVWLNSSSRIQKNIRLNSKIFMERNYKNMTETQYFLELIYTNFLKREKKIKQITN